MLGFLLAMSNPIIFTITDAGLNAALDAENNNLLLNLNKIKLGSGAYVSDESTTAMTSVWGTFDLVSGDVIAETRTLQFSAIANSASKQDVFEIGIFTDADILFAIASIDAVEPFFTVYPSIDFIASFGLSLSNVNANNITITLDSGAALALTVMDQHLAAANPHPQYPLKTALANIIYPVGSWHGTNNAAYNPAIDLMSLFGYETTWALWPYIPLGVYDASQALGQVTYVRDNTIANSIPTATTRIWQRLPDGFSLTISVNRTLATARDRIIFTITGNGVPDGTVINYELFGESIRIQDFRESEVGNSLSASAQFYNNQVQVISTVNWYDHSGGLPYGSNNGYFGDERAVRLRVTGVGAGAVSQPVTIPVIYAGLSQVVCVADGGASNTYFVIATRGIPIGTICTVTCDLGLITETFTLDATGRHILTIPLINEFTGTATQRLFNCELTLMGKTYRDVGTLYKEDTGQFYVKTDAPVMAISTTVLGVIVNPAVDTVFTATEFISKFISGGSYYGEIRAPLNVFSLVTVSNTGSDITLTGKPAPTTAINNFGVVRLRRTPDSMDYSRVLVYKD